MRDVHHVSILFSNLSIQTDGFGVNIVICFACLIKNFTRKFGRIVFKQYFYAFFNPFVISWEQNFLASTIVGARSFSPDDSLPFLFPATERRHTDAAQLFACTLWVCCVIQAFL